MEGEPEPEATLFPATVGEKLRAAREAQGVELSAIALNTRIPQRHLEAIEKSQYATLPSITYALGFAKAYARAVGVDEVAIGRELRGELGGVYDQRAQVPVSYDLEEGGRRAPSGLVWVGVLIAVLVIAGAGIWYGTNWFRGSAPPPETLVIPEATPSAAPTDATGVPGAGGQVALIAIDTVWLRVTDGTGKALFEKEMQPGERYDVPMDADHPRARTARPDKIQVTLNGSNVAPLGVGAETVDVEVSADSLRARGTPGAEATPSPAPTIPASRPTTAPRPRPTRAPVTPVVTPPAAAPGNATAP
ncbi:MAG: RodZ domain-containing protein [Pseudomonadota bacterium]